MTRDHSLPAAQEATLLSSEIRASQYEGQARRVSPSEKLPPPRPTERECSPETVPIALDSEDLLPSGVLERLNLLDKRRVAAFVLSLDRIERLRGHLMLQRSRPTGNIGRREDIQRDPIPEAGDPDFEQVSDSNEKEAGWAGRVQCLRPRFLRSSLETMQSGANGAKGDAGQLHNIASVSQCVSHDLAVR